ncbi:putative solid-state culture specific atp-grasp domain-containing protein [Phaeomoniella chlamydospora]|uniref:Putative solid-state culture specific atp-grasp domain-containing protein n=1 Tax=Phaeomoniella chlamydospora TaxID=158046 RepID=A0A0G2DRT3_PHACM|nr:putative solid-state culture specific atp-grasp domain-containing protein [Phaeomoniella chlamydospora]
MEDFPKIKFDITLADLYASDAKGEDAPRIAIWPVGSLTTVEMDDDYPRNVIYTSQDALIVHPDPQSVAEHFTKLFKIGYLSVLPQRESLAAGSMDAIFTTFDHSLGDVNPQSVKEVKRNFESLDPSQRPRLHFIKKPGDLGDLMKDMNIDSLALKFANDDLAGYRTTAGDLDTFYMINSKAAIPTSGLPTPATRVIHLGPQGFDPRKCCSDCAAYPKAIPIPATCHGPRREWINAQIARAMQVIRSRPLPFVLKTQMSFAGCSTFVARSEAEREDLMQKLDQFALPNILACFTPDNAHLSPADLILMDFVEDVTCHWGLTFFLTQSGKSIFLGASEQRLKDLVHWKGSAISYPDQKWHKERFTPLMNQIGDFVHSYGYYGPMGIDILEVPAGINGVTTSEFLVVDLNVRFSGSLNLVLLGDFFSKQRGLHVATSFFIQSKVDRETLMSRLSQQFKEGRIIIMAWYDDLEGASRSIGFNGGAVIVAGEDHDSMWKAVDALFQHATELSID